MSKFKLMAGALLGVMLSFPVMASICYLPSKGCMEGAISMNAADGNDNNGSMTASVLCLPAYGYYASAQEGMNCLKQTEGVCVGKYYCPGSRCTDMGYSKETCVAENGWNCVTCPYDDDFQKREKSGCPAGFSTSITAENCEGYFETSGSSGGVTCGKCTNMSEEELCLKLWPNAVTSQRTDGCYKCTPLKNGDKPLNNCYNCENLHPGDSGWVYVSSYFPIPSSATNIADITQLDGGAWCFRYKACETINGDLHTEGFCEDGCYGENYTCGKTSVGFGQSIGQPNNNVICDQVDLYGSTQACPSNTTCIQGVCVEDNSQDCSDFPLHILSGDNHAENYDEYMDHVQTYTYYEIPDKCTYCMDGDEKFAKCPHIESMYGDCTGYTQFFVEDNVPDMEGQELAYTTSLNGGLCSYCDEYLDDGNTYNQWISCQTPKCPDGIEYDQTKGLCKYSQSSTMTCEDFDLLTTCTPSCVYTNNARYCREKAAPNGLPCYEYYSQYCPNDCDNSTGLCIETETEKCDEGYTYMPAPKPSGAGSIADIKDATDGTGWCYKMKGCEAINGDLHTEGYCTEGCYENYTCSKREIDFAASHLVCDQVALHACGNNQSCNNGECAAFTCDDYNQQISELVSGGAGYFQIMPVVTARSAVCTGCDAGYTYMPPSKPTNAGSIADVKDSADGFGWCYKMKACENVNGDLHTTGYCTDGCYGNYTCGTTDINFAADHLTCDQVALQACDEGLTCYQGQCVDSSLICTKNADCGSGKVCVDHQCTPKCPEGYTLFTLGYPGGNGVPADVIDAADGNGWCYRLKPCESINGDLHTEGYCTNGCSGNYTCGKTTIHHISLSQVCDQVALNPCDSGKVCSNGQCVDATSVCSTNSDCATSQTCKNGQCTALCSTGYTYMPAPKPTGVGSIADLEDAADGIGWCYKMKTCHEINGDLYNDGYCTNGCRGNTTCGKREIAFAASHMTCDQVALNACSDGKVCNNGQCVTLCEEGYTYMTTTKPTNAGSVADIKDAGDGIGWCYKMKACENINGDLHTPGYCANGCHDNYTCSSTTISFANDHMTCDQVALDPCGNGKTCHNGQCVATCDAGYTYMPPAKPTNAGAIADIKDAGDGYGWCYKMKTCENINGDLHTEGYCTNGCYGNYTCGKKAINFAMDHFVCDQVALNACPSGQTCNNGQCGTPTKTCKEYNSAWVEENACVPGCKNNKLVTCRATTQEGCVEVVETSCGAGNICFAPAPGVSSCASCEFFNALSTCTPQCVYTNHLKDCVVDTTIPGGLTCYKEVGVYCPNGCSNGACVLEE